MDSELKGETPFKLIGLFLWLLALGFASYGAVIQLANFN